LDNNFVELSGKINQNMSFSKTRQGSVQHTVGVEVVVDTQDERLVKESTRLIEQLGRNKTKSKYTVYFGARGVELRRSSHTHKKGILIDFSTIDRRIGAGNLSKKQPLPKAIGDYSTVIDATAGFGKDAMLLALMGYNVIAIEKSPIISVLLRDGMYRAQLNTELNQAIGGRLQFVESNSINYFSNLKNPEVIYIDPMFPPKKKKSALPPGHIQALQSIVGHENQTESTIMFEAALQTATQRVVIKRPTHSQHQKENPVAVHEGKTIRYEVYRPS
jgi:16S rRNA (guanine1516-N2)-methyltransferase